MRRMRRRYAREKSSAGERCSASAPSTEPLVQAADRRRGPVSSCSAANLKTVIAGYHWFSDWGRDTMIALPGLTLATGPPGRRAEHSESFAASVPTTGMLPNRFPDAGEAPEYNTVDATLWLFEAVRAYLQYSRRLRVCAGAPLSEAREIIDWHVRGTRYGIHLDSDGLLACGEPGVQLTWMDAKIGDWVVTPRTGKPVEIQALWYNALRVMQHLAPDSATSGPKRFSASWPTGRKTSFNAQFWNAMRIAFTTSSRRAIATARFARTRSSPSACITTCAAKEAAAGRRSGAARIAHSAWAADSFAQRPELSAPL